jgi:5'-nucleotidase/UDP-sugar diphosphatase
MNRVCLLVSIVSLVSCGPPTDDKTYGEPGVLDTGSVIPDDSGDSSDGPPTITILHTNDWQSHMLGWGPNLEYTPDLTGDDTTVGGLARIKTLVDEIRGASTNPVVLYDGGDWMAGALFQLLGTTHASELQMMEMLGYDAICLGNHEFDWGPNALGEIIAKADELGVTVPILASNTQPSVDDPDDDALEALFDSGRIETVRIDTLDNGIQVGLFGLMGAEAGAVSPMAGPTEFTDATEAATLAVETLQAMGADIIIALSHSGISDNIATSEDEQLALRVPGIDVIVGGHSHTPLFEPITTGGTIILQAGAYTQFLGELELEQKDSGGWAVKAYTLHEVTDTLAGDGAVTEKVDEFVEALELGPLADLGFGFNEPLFQIDGDIVVEACAESGLGDFITDAFRHHLSSLDPGNPVVAAFESQGVIRDNFVAGVSGVEAFSDAFRVMPLGLGGDGVPGYGLVTFYATARDLKNTCEVTGSISPSYGCSYFIEASGIRCHIDWEKGLGNAARGVDLWQDGAWVPLDITDTTELHRVAVDSYVASLMSSLAELTFNTVIINPKDADGNIIEDTSTALFDKDPDTPGVQEVKLWEAIIAYAQTFEDTDGDGLPNVPASYLEAAGRIIDAE